MLDFRLDQEQEMLAQAIRRLAVERLRKIYRDADEESQLPPDVIAAGQEIGLLPTGLPEQYGGFGEYSAVTNAVAIEEFAWGDLATTMAVLQPNLFAMPILLAGTDEQKSFWLPQFCQPQMPAVAAAFTEPTIQFDPYKLQTSAQLSGDIYTLNGRKTMVIDATEADTFLLYADFAGATEAFILPAETPGITIGEREKWMGIRALPTYSVAFENVQIPASAKLGGEAQLNFDAILAHSRVALGAAAVGMGRASYEYALDYAKNRVQFGEPIAHRQSIAFMLAEMAIDIDAARLMVWEAAWELDQGKDALQTTAVLKQTIDEMILRVADRGLQTLGGHGYIREYPVELWFRNARGFAAFDGMLIA